MDGLLYRSTVVNDCEIRQLVAPESRRLQILELAHNSSFGGHFSADKTYDRIKLSFHWPGFHQHIRVHCLNCQDCQKVARHTTFDRVPISPVLRAEAPFEHMSMDCIGPLVPTSAGNIAIYFLLLILSIRRLLALFCVI